MLSFVLQNIIPQAYAQTDCNSGSDGLNLGDCYTLGLGGDKVSDIYSQPTVLINTIITTLFVASGLIFFAMIVYSGFKFISAGTKGKDEAKTIMTTAVAGIIVMFVAYWIVRILEIVTGNPDLIF